MLFAALENEDETVNVWTVVHEELVYDAIRDWPNLIIFEAELVIN